MNFIISFTGHSLYAFNSANDNYFYAEREAETEEEAVAELEKDFFVRTVHSIERLD